MAEVSPSDLLSGDYLAGLADRLSGEGDELGADELGALASAALSRGMREKVIPMTPINSSYAMAHATGNTYRAAPGHDFVVTKIVVDTETIAHLGAMCVTDILVDRKSQFEVSGRCPANAFRFDSNISLQLDKLPNKIDCDVVLSNNSAASDATNVQVSLHGYTASNLIRAFGSKSRR